MYADIMNLHLENAGALERMHPASHKARGLERKPEPHVLPSDSNKAKYHKKITDDWQLVLDSRAESPAHRAAERANAHDYWETRKQSLGITPGMTMEAARERIVRGKGLSMPHPTAAERAAEIATLTRAIAKREQYGRKLDDAIKHNLAGRDNPVVLRKLDALLRYDPDREDEPFAAQQSPFSWQKDHDADRSR
jgi:hypothetical protein